MNLWGCVCVCSVWLGFCYLCLLWKVEFWLQPNLGQRCKGLLHMLMRSKVMYVELFFMWVTMILEFELVEVQLQPNLISRYMQHVSLLLGEWVGLSPDLSLELFLCKLLWYWSSLQVTASLPGVLRKLLLVFLLVFFFQKNNDFSSSSLYSKSCNAESGSVGSELGFHFLCSNACYCSPGGHSYMLLFTCVNKVCVQMFFFFFFFFKW